MARRTLSDSCLALVRCLEQTVPPFLAATGLDSCRIGLSGGADSLALTAACSWVRDHRRGPLAGMKVTARIVDHGLQAGSAAVADQARQQAAGLGIAAEVVRVRVDPAGEGVEAAARQARYSALTMGEPAVILLAHTLDYQAETVLLGLARGSGTRSLAGMPPSRSTILRPLLALRRSQTEQACRDWSLTWWNDPSNEDPAFTRSNLRQAMDALRQLLGQDLSVNLARTANLCREDADYLDTVVSENGIDPSQPSLPLDDLAALPPAIRHRVLLLWLRTTGGDAVTRDHVRTVDELLTHWHGQKSIPVPHATVTRTAHHLRLTPTV